MKVYHVHVEAEEGYYQLTEYNIFKRPMKTYSMTGGRAIRKHLQKFKEKNPHFTSNWSF